MAKYGKTWWGEKWLNAFNDIDESNRLPRGVTYANRGAVSGIKIQDNIIQAKVQGSSPRPYKVQIELKAFDQPIVTRVKKIANQSLSILAQLTNRILPEKLFHELSRENIKLFPEKWSDLKAGCSCPDWAVPCKHIAAVIYLIASEIDKNPFLVFDMHKCNLLQQIEIFEDAKADQVQSIPFLPDLLKGRKETSSQNVDPKILETIDFSKIPDLSPQINDLFKSQPLFYDKNFKDILLAFYKYWRKSLDLFSSRISTFEGRSALLNVFKMWIGRERFSLYIDSHYHFCGIKEGDNAVCQKHELRTVLNFLSTVPAPELHKLCFHARFLDALNQWVVDLIKNTAIIPQLIQHKDGSIFVRWIPALFNVSIGRIYRQFCHLCPEDFVKYYQGKQARYISSEQQVLIAVSKIIQTYICGEFPAVYKKIIANDILQLFFNEGTIACDDFTTKELPQTIALWISRLYLAERPHKLYFIVSEDKNDGFEIQLQVDVEVQGVSQMIPLGDLFNVESEHKTKLNVLSDLALLAEYIPEIEPLIEDPNNARAVFGAKEFTPIFLNVLPVFKSLGVVVVLPKSLRDIIRPKTAIKFSTKDSGMPSTFSLDALLKFDWRVSLGDQMLTIQEFSKLLAGAQGIVRVRDQYVLFEESEIKALLKKLESLPEDLSDAEMLHALFAGSFMNAQVEMEDAVKKILAGLISYDPTEIPNNLTAQLRPYQARGFDWLVKNVSTGFGSIIADDMGLGKTLQVVTTVLHFKNQKRIGSDEGRVLVVVPTGLLSNWEKEFKRFAPSVNVMVHHGSKRELTNPDYDVLLTTYGLIRADKSGAFKKEKWFMVIIDEAQNIKNPDTAQAKSIKNLVAKNRIAMSGTPVENRLLEYWSIFDFTNPGYLGKQKDFIERFSIPIERYRDAEVVQTFTKATQPFMLRRLKSDKTIIQDLPDKIENNHYCALAPEQVALYKEIVDLSMEKIETGTPEERSGLVFQLLTALKQICNHPSQYSKKKTVNVEHSGKMMLFKEIMHSIDELNEKAIIFTQYVEMGNILMRALEDWFESTVAFLTGALSVKERDKLVHAFQNTSQLKILIVSLKAGGTGLNLTAANHVVHYDLWWNPAVEAQATDRAYRIGQQKNVMVHRLITSNTIEEKIDNMINRKKDLANLTIATGEKWLTKLSNDELRDLVSLHQN